MVRALQSAMRNRNAFGRAFLLCAACGLLVQAKPAPYDHKEGPSFLNRRVEYVYQKPYPSIHAVDFRNLTIRTFDDSGNTDGSFSLKKGVYHRKTNGEDTRITVRAIHYLRASPGASQETAALVVFSFSVIGPTFESGGIAQIFVHSGSRLEVVQQLNWDTHFSTQDPTDFFDPIDNTFLLRSAHHLPGDQSCCPSAFDEVTLQWDGRRFVKMEFHTELSDLGKTDGKRLSQ